MSVVVSPEGVVTAPESAAWLEFYNADRPGWSACAYKTPECGGGRAGTHGSTVSRLPDGSWPLVFLWDEINYRIVAKDAAGAVVE